MAPDAWQELLDAQHGVVTPEQAAEHGVTAAMIERRISNGTYKRIGRAVATFASTPSVAAIEVAATLNNPTAKLSHFSAGRRHDLAVPDDGLAHIVVPVAGATPKGRRPRSTKRLKVHKSRHLGDEDVTSRGGLAVTTLERTLIDMFEILERQDDRRKLVAEAFRRRQTTAKRISAAVLRVPQLARRGELLYTVELAAGGSHSVGEMRLYEFIARWELPTPERQFIPGLPRGRRYLDCALPAFKIVLEYDGELQLSDKQKHDDVMRDQLLRRLGWHTIRVTELRMREERQLAEDIWQDILERAGLLGVAPPSPPSWLGTSEATVPTSTVA